MFRKSRTRFYCQDRPCSLRWRAVMIAVALFTTWSMTTEAESAKPGGKGGGKPGGGFLRLCVTIDEQLFADAPGIYSDWLGSYCDGVDRIEAITGSGFRLDTATNSSESTPPIRFVTLNFSSEAFPDPGDPGTHDAPRWFENGDPSPEGLATTDMRFHVEYFSDGNGNLSFADGTPVPDESFREVSNSRMDPTEMLPGEVARAALTVPFRTFEADGSVRQWRLAYGDYPGPTPSMPYAVPVWVTASQTQHSSGEPEYWTIEGTRPALFELVPGKKKNSLVPIFTGYFALPIQMTLKRL